MYEFLVTTSRGIDELLLAEISELCPDVTLSTKPGQVSFQGELSDAYRVCLWSRLANRVFIKLGEGEISRAEDLYNIASAIHWSSHFGLNNDFVVDFVGTNKEINNSQFGALKVKDAIVDQFTEMFDDRPNVSKSDPDIRIHARLRRNQVAIYIDLSGKSLHQRNYRQDTGSAPVKEHVACAMLIRSGWTKNTDKALIDPMCGSGTIAIEAALIASNTAPGLSREHWGFDNWAKHESAVWQPLCEEAKQQITTPSNIIVANELEKKVLNLAKQNADNAGVFRFIQFSNRDAIKLSPPDYVEPGFVVSNPPYGERLGELTSLLPLFQKWGVTFKQNFAQWQVSLLTANRDLLRQLKLLAKKEYKLNNGSLECLLVNYTLDEKNCEIKEQQGEGDFVNRLRKNLKRLNKWVKTQDTNCYRIYDADLPEYNVAIDRYEDWLVVQEYAAPKDVPEQKAMRRLHEVLIGLPQVTGIAPEKLVLKVRAQQKGSSQYQKSASHNETMVVYENGAKFKVNLKDYLDTGLFLDHRTTRQMVKEMAKDKDALNLFSYTGSVSVHMALGGARSVTTVDMSRTYLDWAKDNFKLNNLRGAYEFVQADCTTWLAGHTQTYDLIFIDPPSFSNSKRMGNTWDVQRDHLALLKDAFSCLKPGGKIVFSNNLRQFKLAAEELEAVGLSIENISQQTLPEDFKRNPKIHHCWMMTRTN